MVSTAMCGRRRRSGPARAGAAALATEVEAGKGAAAVAAEVEPWRRGRAPWSWTRSPGLLSRRILPFSASGASSSSSGGLSGQAGRRC
ncbi:Os09g0484000 [Oryza sativa Japonica Group]|uniref:Os09g0484000 protein n=1 Tax=Oryza sativa subsp. japonica TaxID=39947 RepID=A0A0P0XP12_ORYSJ|nr:Os09g0484000 [Oryza sativa Japonica Group]